MTFNMKEYQEKWRKDNYDKILKASREWKARNRQRMNEYRLRYLSELKERVFLKYGKECCHCKFNNPLALHIDHVKGDGNQDRFRGKNKRRRGLDAKFLNEVLRDESGKFQILCANCNTIKFKTEELPRYKDEKRWSREDERWENKEPHD